MLELFSSGLMGAWLDMAGIKPNQLNVADLLEWQGVSLLALPTEPDPADEKTMAQYLRQLSTKGMAAGNQAVWMQSGQSLLANHQGKVPVPAASLTKIATTLAALETWGPAHAFETLIGTTGTIKNGVLQGDLVVTGSGDPFFVWEEAIALSAALNRLGIRRVNGNLIIVGDFSMNYQPNPTLSGQLLKQGLDNKYWPRFTAVQYAAMYPKTPKPQVVIAGGIRVSSVPLPKQILLVRHKSMSLTQIIKQMNIYSNNEMAEMLAKSVGGASMVSQIAAKSAGVPNEEIQLVNGSGLGVENRISPRAACGMLLAIQNHLHSQQMSVADMFPVSGRDRRGTMLARKIPSGTVIKTGTLNAVSALAGVMPTRDRGLVWFAIINGGNDVEAFRQQQDVLLQNLLKRWGVAETPPPAITPSSAIADGAKVLGDIHRNKIVSGFQAKF